ncbi:MAG TPA: hypothetical protein VG733_11335 [Chthoniobacteraceae bacterium]|nr:hypothetical protein [Chthoniobacteraceae bacterium]
MTSRFAKYRRRGIAGLLWFTGLLVSLYFYWWVMANHGIPDFFDPPYGMKRERLRQRVAEYPGHPLWLVMGTSRVVFGFKADVMEDRLRAGKDAPLVFNFGLSGVGLFREYIYFKRLLDDGFTPQRVGIEIFAPDLSQEMFATSSTPSLIVRARKNEIDDYLRYSSTPPDFAGIWRSSRLNPASSYGMLLAHQTRNWLLIPGGGRLEGNVFDGWGWVRMDDVTPQEYRVEFAAARQRYEGDLQNFTITTNADLILRKFLDLCCDKGIPAFLFEMPSGDDFRALHTAKGDAEIAAWLKKIHDDYETQYHFSVPLIDASKWIPQSGFTDGHHLNLAGATEFSNRFAGELDKLRASPTP